MDIEYLGNYYICEKNLDFETLSTVLRDNRKLHQSSLIILRETKKFPQEKTWVLRNYKLGLKRGQFLSVD